MPSITPIEKIILKIQNFKIKLKLKCIEPVDNKRCMFKVKQKQLFQKEIDVYETKF